MKEQLIEFETAKLAKEKGFILDFRPLFYTNKVDLDQGCYMFNTDGNLELVSMPLVGLKNGYIDAPTQSLLQKWLRDEKNTHINVDCNHSGWFLELCKTNGTTIYTDIEIDTENGYLESYEQALEAGLIEGLKYIQSELHNNMTEEGHYYKHKNEKL